MKRRPRPSSRGQNSRAIARPRLRAHPRALAKTRPRPRHAGGRPLLFIPTAVVLRAREIFKNRRVFSEVLLTLEREGNGTWPRKTLFRRVTSRDGQNPATTSAPACSSRQLQAVAKTTALERLEAAAAAAEYDTPAYHRAIAAMHASSLEAEGLEGIKGGPCGCYSCGFVKRPGGRRASRRAA